MYKFELIECENGWILTTSKRVGNGNHAVLHKKVFTDLPLALDAIQGEHEGEYDGKEP